MFMAYDKNKRRYKKVWQTAAIARLRANAIRRKAAKSKTIRTAMSNA